MEPARAPAAELPLPDLLSAVPQVPGDLKKLRARLQFAFSSGESAGALRRLLERAEVPASDWQAASFADDLFVDELIQACFRIPAADFGDDFHPPQSLAYFRRLLVSPPRDVESVRFRQQILAELRDSTALREAFRSVYRCLAELRGDLDSSGLMGVEYSTRRRIDLLLHIKAAVDEVARSLAGAGSGIGRIPAWARAIQASEGYRALRDFVDLEGRLSSVQLRFQIGVDGSVRSLRIVELSENRDNPYFQSPLVRLWGWLRLWWSGSRAGRDELVARAVQTVFDAIEPDLVHLLTLIGHMEFHLAALAFADRCAARGLTTCQARFVADTDRRRLSGLFNPLLLDQERAPVPCDLEVPQRDAMTLITGPNSGGKTRLLQALGLTQLLGQGGLFVPAREAELWSRSGLFVSLIQDASADQAEGRLGTELLRIRELFARTPRGALILLDELCSGTNPSEGEEIVLLVLGLLRELQPEAYITTHFLRFAEQLAGDHAELGLRFWQVQLDDQQEPTYQFVPGVARSSLAGQIARRLGVTRELLLELMAKRERGELESAATPEVPARRESDDDDDDADRPELWPRGRVRFRSRLKLARATRPGPLGW